VTNKDLRDSCFSYQFHDVLTVDFCITANCCPDSNRFSLGRTIDDNAIIVTVEDTAANLCRCVCRHWIHAEFDDLAGDQYRFLVCVEDSAQTDTLYSVNIVRY
jgi:hypothetical protein